jgi:sulfur relay (sulfurtransferase) DsrF/TusC family protein
VNSSASIVFFNRDGVFTAIAHEAPTQMMEAAMDASDRVIQSVKRI